MRAEFCIFESNAPGLKANFYELSSVGLSLLSEEPLRIAISLHFTHDVLDFHLL